ncbi:hypothetical protein FOZ60_000712 [Perkinsus olseni]|uniref:CCHC-type domain-containing protein n=1 Tax=Perkinsus olseni TaxID=32597 RepID=A0A7J6P2J2_PEROL|nr:hypothetical protein FOZ60_000712 [Perkinsus olseni]
MTRRVSVLDSYYCSSLRQRSHVLEGVEARNEEIGGELDDLGEQDGDLISALEKQVEKTRRGRLRVQKSEDRKRKVEQRLMAAYQRMESSSKGRGTVKPIRFRSSPQDATKNKKQAAEDARKRREREYSETPSEATPSPLRPKDYEDARKDARKEADLMSKFKGTDDPRGLDGFLSQLNVRLRLNDSEVVEEIFVNTAESLLQVQRTPEWFEHAFNDTLTELYVNYYDPSMRTLLLAKWQQTQQAHTQSFEEYLKELERQRNMFKSSTETLAGINDSDRNHQETDATNNNADAATGSTPRRVNYKVLRENNRCCRCFRVGHISSVCEAPEPASLSSRCLSCGGSHETSLCRLSQKVGVQNLQCRRCKGSGHVAHICRGVKVANKTPSTSASGLSTTKDDPPEGPSTKTSTSTQQQDDKQDPKVHPLSMLSEMDTDTDPLYTEIRFVAAKPFKCTAMIDTGAARVYVRQSLTKSLEEAGAVAGSRQVNRRIVLADGHEGLVTRPLPLRRLPSMSSSPRVAMSA